MPEINQLKDSALRLKISPEKVFKGSVSIGQKELVRKNPFPIKNIPKGAVVTVKAKGIINRTNQALKASSSAIQKEVTEGIARINSAEKPEPKFSEFKEVDLKRSSVEAKKGVTTDLNI